MAQTATEHIALNGAFSEVLQAAAQINVMPVTEFAVIKLHDQKEELDFLEAVMQCLEIQDDWIRQHQPHKLEHTKDGNLSSIHIDKTTTPGKTTFLIIAPWDSAEAHREWIQSKENQRGFGEMTRYFAPEDDAIMLFHLETAGKRPDLPREIRSAKSFNVVKFTVSQAEREDLQARYSEVESQLPHNGAKGCIWAGWKIEKAIPDEEDLVVFWDDTIPKEQAEQLLSLSPEKMIRRFEHVGHDSCPIAHRL